MKELAVILDPNSLQPKQLLPDYVSSYLFYQHSTTLDLYSSTPL